MKPDLWSLNTRPIRASRSLEQLLFAKGDQIGDRWIIRDVAGRGGMAIVYIAHCRPRNRLVALKTIRDEYLADPAMRAAFAAEMRAWLALESHPHIMEAWFFMEVCGRPFVEMEYLEPAPGLEGCSLADYLKKGRIARRQALEWAIQFCFGMEHAAAQGVACHRDVKPNNILIDGSLKVRIIDFGLARVLDRYSSEASPLSR